MQVPPAVTFEVCILRSECIYLHRTILSQTTTIKTVHTSNRLVCAADTEFVLCEVKTKLLYKTQTRVISVSSSVSSSTPLSSTVGWTCPSLSKHIGERWEIRISIHRPNYCGEWPHSVLVTRRGGLHHAFVTGQSLHYCWEQDPNATSGRKHTTMTELAQSSGKKGPRLSHIAPRFPCTNERGSVRVGHQSNRACMLWWMQKFAFRWYTTYAALFPSTCFS